MISWRLWYALRHPPYRHVLFQHMTAARLRDVYWPRGNRASQAGYWITLSVAALACVLTMLPIGSAIISAAFLVLMLGLPLVAGMLLFNGLIYGGILTARISKAVATNVGRGRFELIALTPPGAMGTSWLIAVAAIYRSGKPTGLNFDHTWYLRAFVLLIFGVLIYESIGPYQYDQNGSVRAAITIVYVLTQALAFHVDDVHSVTTGVVIALMAASWQPRPVAARTAAVVAYITVHVLAYMLTLIVTLDVLPGVWPSDVHWLAAVTLPCLRLAIFYGLREGFISLLWYQLARRLNAGETDMRLLTRWI